MKHANDNTFNNMVIQSLCYLYKECCLNDVDALSCILEDAITNIEKVAKEQECLSEYTEDILRQFHFLKGFKTMTLAERQQVVEQIQILSE